ncbi:phosphoglycerate kinase [hydrocarbon metagenome]|uniref:Phosphoglycerate kinase n=1 Tax=hydrocarbon metagenome TaxID=938273 RepID=A0A0W8FDR7_9ZZZZ
MEIGTLHERETWSGTILLRLDLNSPIDPSSRQILDDKRFLEHLPTIRALDSSRLVIITHQSRPGKKDFTTLEAHAGKLEHLLQRPVTYVDDIFGRSAREAVRQMKAGDIVMLENLRFNAEENLTLKPEDAKKTILVRRLAGMADLYVNDAFGTAHRSQPSIVGLPRVVRTVAGLLMEKEISMLSRVFSGAPRPVTFVLGGTKVDDSVAVAQHVLDAGIADQVIVTGVVANVFLMADGHRIGRPSMQVIEQLKYLGEVERAKKILQEHRDAIMLPEDVAVREHERRAEYGIDAIPDDLPVLDLGTEAIGSFRDRIRESGTVVLNGPAGLFEEEAFAIGTFELLKAAADARFSVVGGGHTGVAIEKIGLEEKISHISTGGGASIEFLTGKKLPAIEALEESKRMFG